MRRPFSFGMIILTAGIAGCASQSNDSRPCLCRGGTPNLVAELSLRDDPYGAQRLGDRVYLAYERLMASWSNDYLLDCYLDRD